MSEQAQHPDLDTLSSSLDTESASVDAHVRRCASCRALRGRLAGARDAVAEPVRPAAAEVRERAIGQALAAFGAHEPVPVPTPVQSPPLEPQVGWPAATPRARPLPLRRTAEPAQSRRWWYAGSAAAAVLALVVGAATMFASKPEQSTSTALRAAPAQDQAEKAAAGAAAGAGAAVVTEGGDLGDVAGIDALRATVANQRQAARSVLAPTAGGLTGGAPAGAVTATADASASAAVPPQVGTRVCEIEARTVRPQVGTVVYAATARFQGTPAVVLGFAPTPGAPPSTLLVLAQAGCRLLAETTLS